MLLASPRGSLPLLLSVTAAAAISTATGCGLSSRAPLLGSQCLRHQGSIYPAKQPGKQAGDTQPHRTHVQPKPNQRNVLQTLHSQPDNQRTVVRTNVKVFEVFQLEF